MTEEETRKLLRLHASAGGFLTSPAGDSPPTIEFAPVAERNEHLIGRLTDIFDGGVHSYGIGVDGLSQNIDELGPVYAYHGAVLIRYALDGI